MWRTIFRGLGGSHDTPTATVGALLGACLSGLGWLDDVVTHLSETTRQTVSLSDEVNEASVLAPNCKALFTKEFCDLLISLEAARP